MQTEDKLLTRILAGQSNRRGFLTLLGRAALGVGAVVAGVGLTTAAAADCDCAPPGYQCCQYDYCGPMEEDIYVSCCHGNDGHWYESHKCVLPNGQIDCFYHFVTTPQCPYAPAH